MHYIVSRAIVSDTLVGHNLGENAHKSSFLRGWDVMKDKIESVMFFQATTDKKSAGKNKRGR